MDEIWYVQGGSVNIAIYIRLLGMLACRNEI